MKIGYMVSYCTEKGDHGSIRGIFTKIEDAQKAAEHFGFFDSDGYIDEQVIYDSYEEFVDNSNADSKGYTVVFYPFEDDEGKPRVAGRFRTEE